MYGLMRACGNASTGGADAQLASGEMNMNAQNKAKKDEIQRYIVFSYCERCVISQEQ